MKSLFLPFVAVVAMVPSVQAKVSEEEAAQLGLTGTPLTPMGAIRQGNEAGSIPEWTGGISSPPCQPGARAPAAAPRPPR